MRPEANWLALRAAWLIAMALWGVAMWMWFDIRDATVRAPVVVLAASAPSLPEPVFVPERARALARVEPATASPAASSLPRKPGDGVLCGVDNATSPSEADVEAQLAQQRQSATQRAIDALATRGDAASSSVAGLLEVARKREQTDRTPIADCRPGADCEARMKANADSAYVQAPQASDRLLEAARSSDDPWIVQLGLLACDLQFGAPKACAGLSPRRLSTLDPDNAAAWLELAARDPSAADEALFRASQASRYDTRASQLAARIDDVLPAGTPPLQRQLVIEQALALTGTYAVSASGAAARHCSEAAVRDANRAQVCERLARLLTRARDSQDALVGHAIGARLGWPDDARQALRDEVRAGGEAMRLALGDAPHGCAAVEQQLAFWRDALRVGDLDATRAAIERSGQSQAALLARSDPQAVRPTTATR